MSQAAKQPILGLKAYSQYEILQNKINVKLVPCIHEVLKKKLLQYVREPNATEKYQKSYKKLDDSPASMSKCLRSPASASGTQLLACKRLWSMKGQGKTGIWLSERAYNYSYV